MPTIARKKSSTHPAATKARFDLLTTIVFFLLLSLPLASQWWAGASNISESENRLLARPPTLKANWESWASFPQRSEAYLDDHLGLRETMIRNFTRIHLAAFGISPSKMLVVGEEGWFFVGDRDAVAHYRGIDPLGPGELKRWQRILEERQAWLAEQGIAYLVVLVPDKHEVYGEYMPASLPRTSEIRPLGQLADQLAEHSNIPFLDLREALAQEKGKRRIYHQTDTHWNDAGAYAAYVAILGQLDETLPNLEASQPVRVRRTRHDSAGLGLAALVGMEEILREEVLSVEVARPHSQIAPEHRAGYARRTRQLLPLAHGVPDPDLPRAVMFRDSFGTALIPFLSEHFSRILYVWERDVDPHVVRIEKPDIVIQEIVGRFLGRRPQGVGERIERARLRPKDEAKELN